MSEAFLSRECGGRAFLTPSCTAALELACMMVVEPGDEVIMPSWTFPSTANAVILRGGIPVFVDVNRHLNISVSAIAEAITPKTKAIMPVHYAGVVCEMPEINEMAEKRGLYVIEDAAQAIGNWKVSGDFGCLSFHYTKNVSCGQGGALIVKNKKFIKKAEIMSHCGTTKAAFNRGDANNYHWLDVGSQYLMSEYQKMNLNSQLVILGEITQRRKSIWEYYQQHIKAEDRCVKVGNGHIFWVMMDDKWERLKTVKATSHYEALHNTIPGRKYGRTSGGITRALDAEKRLVKFNTGVSVDDARAAVESQVKGN